jgi:hypothetical protein
MYFSSLVTITFMLILSTYTVQNFNEKLINIIQLTYFSSPTEYCRVEYFYCHVQFGLKLIHIKPYFPLKSTWNSANIILFSQILAELRKQNLYNVNVSLPTVIFYLTLKALN